MMWPVRNFSGYCC